MLFIAILTGLFFGVTLLFLSIFQFGVSGSRCISSEQPPVSVIIAVKNEAEHLSKVLQRVINQNYPNYEVIIINDHSTDDTLAIAKEFERSHDHLRVLDNDGNGKKLAIKTGIHQAKNELLLFTDADCQPVSHHWIWEMTRCFDQNTSIVLGYSPHKFKIRPENILQQYETLLTACLYITAARFFSPYMAVGRNLAYRRSLFMASDQFESHLNLLSGDDDLFIQQMGTRNNTKVCLSPRSFVISEPTNGLQNLFKQKRRHISTAGSYQKEHQFLLVLFHIARFGTLSGFLALMIFGGHPVQAFIGLLIYFILLQLAYIVPARRLAARKVNWYVPVLEILLMIFQLVLTIDGLVNKKNIGWK